MKLTKARLKQIIKEEIDEEEGLSDRDRMLLPYHRPSPWGSSGHGYAIDHTVTEVLEQLRSSRWAWRYPKMLDKAIELVGGEEEFLKRLADRAHDLAMGGDSYYGDARKYHNIILGILEESF